MPKTSPQHADAQIVYSWFEEEEREDGRGFRISMIVALVVHLAVLFTTIPTLASRETDAPEVKHFVKLAPTPKFKKKPPIPQKPIKPTATSIPMPDPTPDEPDIYVPDEALEPVVDLPIDDLPYDLPTAPPEPPEVPIRVGGDIRPPVRTHFVQPNYTEAARRARLQGVVIVETLVDKQGRVSQAKVLKGMALGLTEEALRAVRQWEFEPSALNGKPVEIVYVVTVRFQLN